MKQFKKIFVIFAVLFVIAALALPVFAETAVIDETQNSESAEADNSKSSKAYAAAIAIAAAAGAGAIAMGIVVAKSVDGISRQPEAEGKIRSSMMLGLVFVETAIIYALIVAILVIFVL
jgi:F-type H+-transporting ATPase subunit c